MIMKTIEEKVAVFKAWLEGERIEASRTGREWAQTNSPSWNWKEFDYRVAPPVFKPRDMLVAKAYVSSAGAMFWTLGEPVNDWNSKRVPEFDLVANT